MKKKYSIALIFSGDFPEGNTKNSRLKSLGLRAKEEGWNVKFVTLYPYQFSNSHGYDQMNEWNNIQVTQLSFGKKYFTTRLWRFFQVLTGIIALPFYLIFNLRSFKFFYFYNPRFLDTMLGLLTLKLFDKTVIIDQTELYSSNPENKKRIHLIEEHIIAHKANVLFCISDKIFDHYRAIRDSQKVMYKLPIMVSLIRFKELVKEKPFLIGYVGSYAIKDGLDNLLKGFQLAKLKLPHLKLRLIGHNPISSELRNRCEELGLSEDVQITGTVRYNEIPRLLKECDSLIMNRNDSQFARYGYPVKLGEYFASNRTVLMSDIDGFSNDFENGNQAFLYTPDDPVSLSNSIRYRYKNKDEAHAVANRGYSHAQEYYDEKKVTSFFINTLKQIPV